MAVDAAGPIHPVRGPDHRLLGSRGRSSEPGTRPLTAITGRGVPIPSIVRSYSTKSGRSGEGRGRAEAREFQGGAA